MPQPAHRKCSTTKSGSSVFVNTFRGLVRSARTERNRRTAPTSLIQLKPFVGNRMLSQRPIGRRDPCKTFKTTVAERIVWITKKGVTVYCDIMWFGRWIGEWRVKILFGIRPNLWVHHGVRRNVRFTREPAPTVLCCNVRKRPCAQTLYRENKSE